MGISTQNLLLVGHPSMASMSELRPYTQFFHETVITDPSCAAVGEAGGQEKDLTQPLQCSHDIS